MGFLAGRGDRENVCLRKSVVCVCISLRVSTCPLCVRVARCLCEVVFLWALCVGGCVLCVCTQVPPPRDTKLKGPRRWSQDGGWGRGRGQDPVMRRKCGSWEGICFSRPRSSPTSLMTPNKRQTAGSRLDPPMQGSGRGQVGTSCRDRGSHSSAAAGKSIRQDSAGQRYYFKRSEQRTGQVAPGVSTLSLGPSAAQATLAGPMTGALCWGGGACLSGC